jgi:hypothetical protein
MLNRATSFEELWNSPKRKYLMNKHDKLVDCNFFCIRDETNQLIDHWLEGGIPEISDTVNDLFI